MKIIIELKSAASTKQEKPYCLNSDLCHCLCFLHAVTNFFTLNKVTPPISLYFNVFSCRQTSSLPVLNTVARRLCFGMHSFSSLTAGMRHRHAGAPSPAIRWTNSWHVAANPNTVKISLSYFIRMFVWYILMAFYIIFMNNHMWLSIIFIDNHKRKSFPSMYYYTVESVASHCDNSSWHMLLFFIEIGELINEVLIDIYCDVKTQHQTLQH